MKKWIVLFVFLFGIISVGAQPYQSLFGDSSTAWKTVFTNLNFQGTDSNRTDGDTIINTLKYKKILGNFPICCNTLVGFLREDTLTGKAWYFSALDTKEKLIMDLNLTVGDSIKLEDYWPDTGFVFVDSIYFYSGRKYVRLNTTLNQQDGAFGEKLVFIEGIGTNRNFQYLDPYSLNLSSYLLCSYKDYQLVYTNANPNFDQCNLLTLVSEKRNNNRSVKIIPNPVINISILKFDNPTNSKFILNTYDLTGRRLKEYTTTTDSFEIRSEDYNQGLFFCHLFDVSNSVSIDSKFNIY